MKHNCATMEDALVEAKSSHSRQFWAVQEEHKVEQPKSGLAPRNCIIDADALGLLINRAESESRYSLSNTAILFFVLGFQGGTVHQLARILEVEQWDILNADADKMEELCRRAQEIRNKREKKGNSSGISAKSLDDFVNAQDETSFNQNPIHGWPGASNVVQYIRDLEDSVERHGSMVESLVHVLDRVSEADTPGVAKDIVQMYRQRLAI